MELPLPRLLPETLPLLLGRRVVVAELPLPEDEELLREVVPYEDEEEDVERLVV